MDGERYMVHLVDSRGCFISHESFCLKYDITCSQNTFNSVIKAIPNAFMCLIQGYLSTTNPHTFCLPLLLVEGVDFKEIKLPNKIIRNMFDNILFPIASYRNLISQFFSKKKYSQFTNNLLKIPFNSQS